MPALGSKTLFFVKYVDIYFGKNKELILFSEFKPKTGEKKPWIRSSR